MKRIYQAADLVDAELMADHLREALIPVEIFNQHIGSGFGELPASYPELWVRRDADAGKAEELVKKLHQRNQKSLAQPDVSCQQCLEMSPASFEFCWQCQAALDNG